jgi:hypothetical protein
MPKKGLAEKSLPALPAPALESKVFRVILIILGLLIWFFAIVILLPIILERDAMPGLNRLLRRIAGATLPSAGFEHKPPQLTAK